MNAVLCICIVWADAYFHYKKHLWFMLYSRQSQASQTMFQNDSDGDSNGEEFLFPWQIIYLHFFPQYCCCEAN